MIAFGGIQDCTAQFPDVPEADLRAAAAAGACAALGVQVLGQA
ncbi:hypothetical protein HDA40_002781 [Hamadaea flava]|uniref:Uncharacterized protein n=1 Tax=Hamadaea flava TaxID=1742688 RepID=A0ABV8LGW6_9ACTN|nr:hypothetical protein [Hamadaea flava]MCP2324274.1 hypothetical protein [Hamadaea flava]